MKTKNRTMSYNLKNLEVMREILYNLYITIPLRHGEWYIQPDLSNESVYEWIVTLDVTSLDDFCVFHIRRDSSDKDRPRFFAKSVRYMGVDKMEKECPLSNILDNLLEDYDNWIIRLRERSHV